MNTNPLTTQPKSNRKEVMPLDTNKPSTDLALLGTPVTKAL